MKKPISTLFAALAVILMSSAASTSQAAGPKQLRFGLLPAEDPTLMVEQFSGIAKHVGKTLGLPVNVKVSESYNALIEGMRAGHLEIVYVGGGQYL